MPEVSILLPSLRREGAIKRIEEFAKTNGEVDYEIVVVSPFEVEGERVIHIQEDEPRGTVYANNLAYGNSSGKYIINWTDDISPTKSCLANMLKFVKAKREPFIGVFRQKLKNGEEWPQWLIYGKLQACWGCASRNTMTMIGGYLDPVFKSFWADPDMSLRTWEKGGRVEVCRRAWLVVDAPEYGGSNVTENNAIKYREKDKEIFLTRWHKKLGKGMPREPNAINKPLHLSWKVRRKELKNKVILIKVNLLVWMKSRIGYKGYEIIKKSWYLIRGKRIESSWE